jgi:hypothetical protein
VTTDRELGQLWKHYQTLLEAALIRADELGLPCEASVLRAYADKAKGQADAFRQSGEKDNSAFDHIKGVIGG